MSAGKNSQHPLPWFWRSWVWVAVWVSGWILLLATAVTDWHPLPIRQVFIIWLIGAFEWSLWWLATGASVAAIALWIGAGLVVLLVSLPTWPQALVGVPSAIFFGMWAVVSAWDPARRLWQRANAWLTWPLFVGAVPAEQRDRYRRYRDTTHLPALATLGDDTARKVSELRATAERVLALDAPSTAWSEVRRAVADGCETWADMLEGKMPWDGTAIITAFERRDAAWEALFRHLSPWGWRLLMWGPARRDGAS